MIRKVFTPRFSCLILFILISQALHSQCSINARLTSSGSRCSDYGTAFVSGIADSASKIEWYQNGVLIKTTDRVPYDGNGVTVAGGIGPGTSWNKLSNPTRVAIDKTGRIIVSEAGNRRTMWFPPNSTAGTTGHTIMDDYSGGAFDVGANTGMRIDCDGNVFVTETMDAGLYKNGHIIAGGKGNGNSSITLNAPQGLAVDCGGDIFIADAGNNRIFKFPAWSYGPWWYPPLIPGGDIVAGGNGYGSAANQLANPHDVFLAPNGEIYVADKGNYRIQKFPVGSESYTNGATVAGNGYGTALNQFSPTSILLDGQGNLYVCDNSNNRILKFPPNSTAGTFGVVVAGGNGYGSAANQLASPMGIDLDWLGNLYVADQINYRIQRFALNGTLDTSCAIPESGNVTAVITYPSGCVISSDVMNIPVALGASVSIAAKVDTVCQGAFASFKATGINTGCTPVYQWYKNGIPSGINADTFSIRPVLSSDTVWVDMSVSSPYLQNITVRSNKEVVRVEPLPPLTVSRRGLGCVGNDTLVVSGTYAMPGTDWYLYWYKDGEVNPSKYFAPTNFSTFVNTIYPGVLKVGPGDTVYVFDEGVTRGVRKFPPNTNLKGSEGTIVAGGHGLGHGRNQISGYGMHISTNGDIYFSDEWTSRILKFPAGSDSNTIGKIVAGTQVAGLSSNQLYNPRGITLDSAGYLYVADYLNYRVQRFPPNSDSGTVGVTVAGGNGYGNAANQIGAFDVAIDKDGNLLVLDVQNDRVQKFPRGSTSATNAVTIIGRGKGSAPDQLDGAQKMFLDKDGSLYVSDGGNHRVLKFPPNVTQGTPGTVVAGGVGNYSWPNALAYNTGLAIDSKHNLIISDNQNERVQKYQPERIVDTIFVPTQPGQYRAVLRSPLVCYDSSALLTTAPSPVPTINIAGSSSSTFCTFTSDILYTATISNGGPTPSIKWYKNGVLKADSPTYLATGLKTKDSIWAVLTSSLDCVYPRTATSNLFIHTSVIKRDTSTITLCQGSYYQLPHRQVNKTGTYSDTLYTSGGCDTIFTVKLTVTPMPTRQVQVSTFGTSGYYFNGRTIYTNGIYLDTLQNGCDTIIRLSLTFLPAKRDTIRYSSCDGSGYFFKGRLLQTSGTYYDTLATSVQGGCDTIRTLLLSVGTTVNSNYPYTMCDGDSMFAGGRWRFTSQIVYDTSLTSQGCLKIVKFDVQVKPRPVINETDTIKTVCQYQDVVLKVNMLPGIQYYWSDPYLWDMFQYIYYEHNANFVVQATDSGSVWLYAVNIYDCAAAQPYYVYVTYPQAQSLCLVTVDSALTHTSVLWEKENKEAVDSFIIYRANTPDTTYTEVGMVHRDSLSVFEDLNSTPNLLSYRYKIAAKDTCGNIGPLSPYHQTIYLQTNGTGNFSWTPYIIEGSSMIIGSYAFYRDSLGTGDWQLQEVIAGNQTSTIDPTFNQYPNARYKVVITLTNPCNPSRSYITITSNIVSKIITGVSAANKGSIRLLYNPVHQTAQVVNTGEAVTFRLVDNTGRILQTITSGNLVTDIDLEYYAAGLYYIVASNPTHTTTLKVVKY